MKKKLLSGLLILLTIAMTACGKTGSSESATINIATKGFAESDIMANAIKLLIENDTKLKTKISKLDNNLLWEGMKAGQVDTYVEYTGTALINILKEQPEYDSQKAYEKVVKLLAEKNQIIALDRIGFNDTYAFVMRKEDAEKYQIKTTSQLAEKSNEFIFGGDQLFINRPDAWPEVIKVYHPKFKGIKTIENGGLMYKALEQKLIDTFVLYTTDSKIKASPLVLLEDDKHVFLPYDAIPVIRGSVLKAHPELKKVLNKLSGKITDAKMQALNGEVELKQKPAHEVAKEWLISEGLIKS
jgi:osmoprotectant transport system substrate-binding protein